MFPINCTNLNPIKPKVTDGVRTSLVQLPVMQNGYNIPDQFLHSVNKFRVLVRWERLKSKQQTTKRNFRK